MAYERFDPDRYRPALSGFRERRTKPTGASRPAMPVEQPHCRSRAEGDEYVCPTRGCLLRWAHDEERPDCPLGLHE